jgi:ribosomal protein S27E
MEHLITCKCGEVVVKSANGTTKIRNKMMVFKDGRSYAVCKGCGAEIQVPVRLEPAEISDNNRRPKLFLQDRK